MTWNAWIYALGEFRELSPTAQPRDRLILTLTRLSTRFAKIATASFEGQSEIAWQKNF